MNRDAYNKIDSISKFITTIIPLPVSYAAIYLSKSFIVASLITLASFIPYLIGYNILVRGWLSRKIEN
jgi:hypothetical protein